jgi:hypothetical protein
MKVERLRVGGKPLRLATTEVALYPISVADIRFRQQTVECLIKEKYGKLFSAYQVDVFCVLCRLVEMEYDVSYSYQQLCESGLIRGLMRQDVQRSLEILERLGLLEAFGKTQSGKYDKYRLTHAGDDLWAWINREMSAPYEVFRYKSKGFVGQGVEVSASATTEPSADR